MSDRKVPRITNLWTKVVDGETSEWFSKVVIESTRPYAYAARETCDKFLVQGKGVIVNMPEGSTEVNDGLLREVNVKMDGKGTASVETVLEYPAEFQVTALEGFPFRLVVTFNRSFIAGLFSGKRIVIDPGHGGFDIGGKGPVSLQEKDVVLSIAKNLEHILLRAGADVVLTRNEDENITRDKRFDLARQAGADVYVGIHTHASADSKVEGIATLYAPNNGQSALLARYVQEGLIKKLKANNRGVTQGPELAALNEIPAIEVEVLAITNLVEEVFLRGLTVRKKAAEGIFNGLIKYFAFNGANAKGEFK